jgi:trans-aconitate methyltransferase
MTETQPPTRLIAIERYDAVNPSNVEEAASLGYGPGDVGELLVQRDGEYIGTANRLEDAQKMIADDSGIPVNMIHAKWRDHESRFIFDLTL